MKIEKHPEHGYYDIYPFEDTGPFATRISVHFENPNEGQDWPTIGINGWHADVESAREFAKAILKACEIADKQT